MSASPLTKVVSNATFSFEVPGSYLERTRPGTGVVVLGDPLGPTLVAAYTSVSDLTGDLALEAAVGVVAHRMRNTGSVTETPLVLPGRSSSPTRGARIQQPEAQVSVSVGAIWSAEAEIVVVEVWEAGTRGEIHDTALSILSSLMSRGGAAGSRSEVAGRVVN